MWYLLINVQSTTCCSVCIKPTSILTNLPSEDKYKLLDLNRATGLLFLSLFFHTFLLSLRDLRAHYRLTTASSKSSAKFVWKWNHTAFLLTLDVFNFELASLWTNQLRALGAGLRQHIWLRTLRKLQERKCDVALTHNKNGKAISQTVLNLLCLHPSCSKFVTDT